VWPGGYSAYSTGVTLNLAFAFDVDASLIFKHRFFFRSGYLFSHSFICFLPRRYSIGSKSVTPLLTQAVQRP
jgi:hypothetical protein